jgi:hypothetical protein
LFCREETSFVGSVLFLEVIVEVTILRIFSGLLLSMKQNWMSLFGLGAGTY